MRTRNRRLGPLVQHPPPPLPGRHHTTTSRKSTHNNTKGSGLNKPPQNPGFDTPAKGHCTRYVALHPLRGAAPVTSRCTRTEGVQCLQIGCTTPATSSHADLPERTSTDPTGLAGPGGNEPQTANRARRRQGLAGLRDNAPSGRAAEPARGAHIQRARTRGTHTTSPHAEHTYNEPGRRARIRRARTRGTHTTRPGPAARNSTTDPRPREKIKPSDPP